MKLRLKRLTLGSRRQTGFSLLELLIYVTIFSTMIGGVVGLAVLASGQKFNSQAAADINFQGEAAMAYMTQTVHRASSITSPAAGSSATSLTLAMATGSVNPTVFSSFNNNGTNQLRVSEGSPAINNYLTNSHATISNLNFTNKSLSSTKGSVLISFTLSYKTSSARQEFNFSKNFFGAATIQ